MQFDVLTLFPEMFDILNESIIGRAKEKGLINVNLINIRDFSKNKHKKVDDTPYGGGAGMVIQPDVVYDAYKSVIKNNDKSGLDEKSKKTRVIYMSPQGKKLDQQKVEELSKQEHLILLCGHYEGIDQRVLDTIVDEEISIGDYVLTGGELPAMVLIDSVSRYVEGVLKDGSTTEESFSQGLLEYPQYTRPEVFEEQQVPEVLLSGNHQMIDKWRREQSLKRTLEKRPDLLEKVDLSDEDKKILEKIKNDVPNKVGTAQIKEGGKF
jgi:tRNA (guanine-N(1)-)-methyltransferase